MPTRTLMRAQKTPVATGSQRAVSSRHFLKPIEDTGKVGFWSADLRTERMDASPGLYRILGLDPATPMTFGFGLDMIHPEDKAILGRRLKSQPGPDDGIRCREDRRDGGRVVAQ